MDTPYSRRVEGRCKDAVPRGMTADSNRPILDVPWQPAVCGDKTSSLEALCQNPAERQPDEFSPYRMQETSNPHPPYQHGHRSYQEQPDEFSPYRMQETSNPHPPYQHGHRSYQEAFPGGVTQKELQEKEEYKKLKEKNKELQAKQPDEFSPYRMQETSNPHPPYQHGHRSYQEQPDEFSPYRMQETSNPHPPYQHGHRSYQEQPDEFSPYRMQETSNPHPPYQHGHRSYQEAFPGGVTQKELQEKEEYKKLKEKNKELQAKNKELLAKVMGMHKNSENMNDPLRFSAVLQAYEMLKLRDWEQFRTSTYPFLTYETGSSIIQKLFAACEKDVCQRINTTLAALGIPSLNDTKTDSKEGVMEQIRSLLRYSYHQNNSELYSKILMDPPVEAVWNLQESLLKYSEHVDKKDREHWRNPKFLWPVMKCGEEVIGKGVVWDEK